MTLVYRKIVSPVTAVQADVDRIHLELVCGNNNIWLVISSAFVTGIWSSSLFILLTHYVEAAVQLADSVSRPPLAHLADLRPLVEVGVEPLHAGQ